MPRLPLTLLTVALLGTVSVLAQPASPAPVAPEQGAQPTQPATGHEFVQTEEEAASLGPKNKLFIDNLFAYKEILKQLNDWKVEYPTANAQRKAGIEAEFETKYSEGDKMRHDLIDLALDAFDEAPRRNPFAEIFLCQLVEWEYKRDNFDESYRLFKRLSAKGFHADARVIYTFAGLSALMCMHLDEAEAWLKVARDEGFFDKYLEALGQEGNKGQEKLMSLMGLIRSIPEFRKSWAVEEATRKAEAEAGAADPEKKLPRVVLHTTKGDIVLELFENEAPNSVANFISLIEKKMPDGKMYYENCPFHRVLPGFMAQGGDPTGTGMGGPGYEIACECRQPGYRKHFRGSLSMANAGPDTNGSQFFLTFVPTSFLDGRHTVFGRVVEGISVLADLQRIDPSDTEGVVPVADKILSAEVLNKRNHEYKPVTIPER